MASPLPKHQQFPSAPETPAAESIASSIAPDGGRRCLNCGAPLATPFCPHCGQRDIDATLSVRDFIHELVAEHFGLDSKVARTLFALVRWPGRLTREFVEGRRVRYVPPLRLYLSLSVIFFLVSALTDRGPSRNSNGVIEAGGGVVRIDTADAHVNTTGKWDSTPGLLRDTLHSGAVGRWFKRRANRRIGEFRTQGTTAGTQFGNEFKRELPDAIFLLVPMLALMLGVVYYRQHRYYAEHLVFALHFQAFVFAALLVALIPIPLLDVAVWFGGIAYAYVALRTVYAEGRGSTALKLTMLGAGYALCTIVVMTLLALVVFLFG